MNKSKILITLATTALLASSCATHHYTITGVERSRILIDSRYDNAQNQEAVAFLAPYKERVDAMMSPVMGYAAHDMSTHRPESELSNLLADVLIWSSKAFNEKPDFAVYNIGGIRAAITKGAVTKGDILDVAPFENKICFLTLTGER